MYNSLNFWMFSTKNLTYCIFNVILKPLSSQSWRLSAEFAIIHHKYIHHPAALKNFLKK